MRMNLHHLPRNGAIPPFLAILALSACMKAERLGTDTNSPQGFVLGSFGLGAGSGAAAARTSSP